MISGCNIVCADLDKFTDSDTPGIKVSKMHSGRPLRYEYVYMPVNQHRQLQVIRQKIILSEVIRPIHVVRSHDGRTCMSSSLMSNRPSKANQRSSVDAHYHCL